MASLGFGISATLSVLYLFSLVFLSVPHPSLSQQPDIHDLFPRVFGLPPGLIPNNVAFYDVDRDSGSFFIKLSWPCSVRIPFPVEYSEEITGNIRYGAVSDLQGVRVLGPVGFAPLTEINVIDNGAGIEFHAGDDTQTLPAFLFQRVPACENEGAAASLKSVV
ncbi:hypothetical protein Tsubulata_006120 [Turnera subulata]|uniref:Uncharacterized protein n=1 Tax=Turnera subulata TaxID=218843 RepID=A0A9Q0G243_9ROSI|nr:hypothetical protein Tsubulata_006120 [Turnera subulata]